MKNQIVISNIEIVLIFFIIGVAAVLATLIFSQQKIASYDATIKSQLAEIQLAMNYCHDQQKNSFENCFKSENYQLPKCSISEKIEVKTSNYGANFIAFAKLCSNRKYFCADSTGFIGQRNTLAVDGNSCK